MRQQDIDELHGRQLVTGPEAAKIAGLSYRKVDHLDRLGIVQPTVPAEGSGTARGYSVFDVARLWVAAELAQWGITNAVTLRHFLGSGTDVTLLGRAVTLMAHLDAAERAVRDGFAAVVGGDS